MLPIVGNVELSVQVGVALGVVAVLGAEGHTLAAGHTEGVGLWGVAATECFSTPQEDLAAAGRQEEDWAVVVC